MYVASRKQLKMTPEEIRNIKVLKNVNELENYNEEKR